MPNRTGLQPGLGLRWQHENKRHAISSKIKFAPLLECHYGEVEPVSLKPIKAVRAKHTAETGFLPSVEAPLKAVSHFVA